MGTSQLAYLLEEIEPVTAPQLVALVEGSGLSKRRFSELLGVSRETLRRWMDGTHPIPLATGKLIALLAPFDDPKHGSTP